MSYTVKDEVAESSIGGEEGGRPGSVHHQSQGAQRQDLEPTQVERENNIPRGRGHLFMHIICFVFSFENL